MRTTWPPCANCERTDFIIITYVLYFADLLFVYLCVPVYVCVYLAHWCWWMVHAEWQWFVHINWQSKYTNEKKTIFPIVKKTQIIDITGIHTPTHRPRKWTIIQHGMFMYTYTKTLHMIIIINASVWSTSQAASAISSAPKCLHWLFMHFFCYFCCSASAFFTHQHHHHHQRRLQLQCDNNNMFCSNNKDIGLDLMGIIQIKMPQTTTYRMNEAAHMIMLLSFQIFVHSRSIHSFTKRLPIIIYSLEVASASIIDNSRHFFRKNSFSLRSLIYYSKFDPNFAVNIPRSRYPSSSLA